LHQTLLNPLTHGRPTSPKQQHYKQQPTLTNNTTAATQAVQIRLLTKQQQQQQVGQAAGVSQSPKPCCQVPPGLI
jgi:hypothetical protein